MPAVGLWGGELWGASVALSLTLVALTADDSNQSPTVQAAIDGVADGTAAAPRVLRLPVGRYRLDDTISVSSRSHLVIEGPLTGEFVGYTDMDGVELEDVDGGGDSLRQHWAVTGSTSVKLKRINVEGPNDQREEADTDFADYQTNRAFEHGFAVQGACADVDVLNCTASQVWGDAVYVGGTGDQNLDITIKDFVGTYCGRQAAGIVNVDGLLMEDVDIQWGGRSGLDIEPNHDSHYVKNATFRRVTMGTRFYPFIVGGSWGDTNPHVENIVLEDCVGVNSISSHTAILANAHKTNLTIRRHTDLRNRSTQCITIGNTGGTVIVEDCEVTSGPSTPTSYGVDLNNVAATVTITGCTFNGVAGTPPLGADELYGVNVGTTGDEPASITTCGNVWNEGNSNDGEC